MPNRFVQKLSKLVAFEPADLAAIEAVTARGRAYHPRQDLIREGDEPGPMFVILDGWACRYKILPGGGRQIMAFMMPGDACDLHVHMLSEMDHGIQALTAATVVAVAKTDIHTMMQDHPNIALAMYRAQLIDEGIMRAWIVSMGRRTSIERVAHLMCELYLRASAIGLTTGNEVAFPLSQLVLADALGMTVVHINRVLKALREEGARTLRRGTLKIQCSAKFVGNALMVTTLPR